MIESPLIACTGVEETCLDVSTSAVICRTYCTSTQKSFSGQCRCWNPAPDIVTRFPPLTGALQRTVPAGKQAPASIFLILDGVYCVGGNQTGTSEPIIELHPARYPNFAVVVGEGSTAVRPCALWMSRLTVALVS